MATPLVAVTFSLIDPCNLAYLPFAVKRGFIPGGLARLSRPPNFELISAPEQVQNVPHFPIYLRAQGTLTVTFSRLMVESSLTCI